MVLSLQKISFTYQGIYDTSVVVRNLVKASVLNNKNIFFLYRKMWNTLIVIEYLANIYWIEIYISHSLKNWNGFLNNFSGYSQILQG